MFDNLTEYAVDRLYLCVVSVPVELLSQKMVAVGRIAYNCSCVSRAARICIITLKSDCTSRIGINDFEVQSEKTREKFFVWKIYNTDGLFNYHFVCLSASCQFDVVDT